MYRIFILESGTLSMLPEGPFTTHDEALTFGKAEVGPPFVVLEVHVDTIDADDADDEEGWMRVYYEGEHIGDTPVRIYSDNRWDMCDGSYGLLEHLQDLGVPQYQDVCHNLEAEAMGMLVKDRAAMYQCLGYTIVYIPGNKQSI